MKIPTTEDVRTMYAGINFASGYGQEIRLVREAEFERWLRTVKAEAWDECWERAEDMLAMPAENRNPYREEPVPDGRVTCDCADTGRIWCCMPDKHRSE